MATKSANKVQATDVKVIRARRSFQQLTSTSYDASVAFDAIAEGHIVVQSVRYVDAIHAVFSQVVEMRRTTRCNRPAFAYKLANGDSSYSFADDRTATFHQFTIDAT